MLVTLNFVCGLATIFVAGFAVWTGFRVIRKFEHFWTFRLKNLRQGQGTAVLFAAIISSTTACVNFIVLNGSWLANMRWTDIGDAHSLMWMVYHLFSTVSIAAVHRTILVLLYADSDLMKRLERASLWGRE